MFRDTLRTIMLDNALLGLSEHYLDHCDPMFPGQGSGAVSPSSPGLDPSEYLSDFISPSDMLVSIEPSPTGSALCNNLD